VRVEFAAPHVQALTHGQLQSLNLLTRHELFDDQVSRLTIGLAEEAMSGMPNGELYVQGLCIALLGLLDARYTKGISVDRDHRRMLDARQRRRLADLIRQDLGSKLSLNRMAAEVGVSPHHFARLDGPGPWP